jgi:FAD-dependent urate hydroxylase
MTSTRTALIIGGGIAGASAALALQRAGIEPVIYEAHPAGDNQATAIGGYLILGSNGVDALRILGIDAAALTVGYPTPGITLRSSSGKALGISRTSQSLPNPATSRTFRRIDLHQVLHEQTARKAVPIEYGKRLVCAERTAAGVRAIFDDGSEAVGDLLIGCDGLHSAVRTIIDPDAPAPTYAGIVTIGGYTRGAPLDIEPGSYDMIFGKRAFFGYSVAPDNEVWWFAYMSQPTQPARHELLAISTDQWQTRLGKLYAGDTGPALDIIRATDAFVQPQLIHAIPHLPRWHNEKMVVIGDAAHAPSPTSGQGASLSIEDGVILAKCLRDLPDTSAAFTHFEKLRRDRVEEIIKGATRINASTAVGPIGRVLRDAMLPTLLKLTTNGKAHKKIYDYRIDWNAPTLELP